MRCDLDGANMRTKVKYQFIAWWSAALLAALLTILAVALFYLSGGASSFTPPLHFQTHELQVIAGSAVSTTHGLEIHSTDAEQGAAIVRAVLPRPTPARLLRHVAWHIDGLAAGQELYLLWIATLDGKAQTYQRALPALAQGTVDVSSEAHWQGRIGSIALVISGKVSAPLFIRDIALLPAAPPLADMLQLALEEWRTLGTWNQGSINFAAGSSIRPLFPPLLMVALWVGLSTLLYAALQPSKPRALLPYAAFFLSAWLVLDAHWQWELWERLRSSCAQFAAKDMHQRRLADLDGHLYAFISQLRQRLPPTPARLYIVSSDPSGFYAGRARYHLLPHNAYPGFFLPPAAPVGDYLLLLQPLPTVHYDAAQQLLYWEGGQLPVEALYSDRQGALFRVRGG